MNETELRDRLPIGPLGRRLFFYDETDSTNARALAALEAGTAEEGDLYVARRQTAGRGSRGRSWHSPDGGLWFSLVCRRKPPEPVSFWPGLALKRTLRAWSVESWMKWPNDLIVADKKIAGILVEAVIQGRETKGWVVGVGVDLSVEEFPPELSKIATSVRRETGQTPEASAFLASLLIQMKDIAHDDLHLLDLVRDESDLVGRRLAVRRGEEQFAATVLALTSRGHLRIQRDDGEEETWVSSSDLELSPLPPTSD